MNFNILKNINLSNIISYSSKTLNVIKKTIPVYKEIRPYITKEKTIINKDLIQNKEGSTKPPSYNNNLTFFH